MKRTPPQLLVLSVTYVLVIVLLLFAAFGWTIVQWSECRDMGHSRLYCIGHVMK